MISGFNCQNEELLVSQSAQSKAGGVSKVKVRFENTQVSYASQFIVNASAEEVILNFAAGYINDDRNPDGNILPVHTRVALSPAGARRLITTLSKALRNVDEARRLHEGKIESEQKPN